MKSFFLFLLVATLPAAARARDAFHIQEVGLEGFYATTVPTPVRIHIPALAESQTIRLVTTIQSKDLSNPGNWAEPDQFEKQVTVIAGKPLDVEIPILLSVFEHLDLHVVGIDQQGRVMGEDHIALAPRNNARVIAVYCRDDAECVKAQTQISPITKEGENAVAKRDLHIAVLRDLRPHWLAYRAANAVVVAGSIAGATPDELAGLEYYVRSGGALVLAEKECSASQFLAPYRHSGDATERIRVGRGSLYRVTSLESNGLALLFPPAKDPDYSGRIFDQNSGSAIAAAYLQQIGIKFSFPHLRWLLIWLGSYILIIGLVNFSILKKLRKVEWGWITVSAMALLFAVGVYIASSSGRPQHFTLDNAIVYWMDGQSPIASEDWGWRIYSPERTNVELTVGEDALLASLPNFTRDEASGEYVGLGVTGNHSAGQRWQVNLGPPLRIKIPMRRWAFKDFYATGFHSFAGPVHWTSKTRLKNDTGQRFKEAIYMDFPANKLYAIPGMAPGEEVDLASVRNKEIYGEGQVSNFIVVDGQELLLSMPSGSRFSLGELPYSGLTAGHSMHLFAGVMESAGISARLDSPAVNRSQLTLAMVALDQP